MFTVTTVTEGNGTVLSKLLVDLEVDFLDDLPAARSFSGVLVALACRLVDGLTVRPTFPRGSRAQAARAAECNALGRAEWRRPAAHRVISSAFQI